jgi:hypothetical protein
MITMPRRAGAVLAAAVLFAAFVPGSEGAVFPQAQPTVVVPRYPCLASSPRRTYIKASNTDATDRFGGLSGKSLALSADGQTLAVGAELEASNAAGIGGNQADNTADESGAVYVFVRSGQSWVQQAYIKASNAQAGDRFGQSVALSADGNTLVVGAPDEDSDATGVGGNEWADPWDFNDIGAAYVFVRNGQTWSQQVYLKSWGVDREGYDAHFGAAVALSADGNRVVVGSPRVDAVFIYDRSGTAWTARAHMQIPRITVSPIGFGESLALNAVGDTLAVGAPGEDGASPGINGDETNRSAANTGAVYVYQRTQLLFFTVWTRQAYIKAADVDNDDHFGEAIALSESGNVLAVGSPGEDGGIAGVNGNESDESLSGSGAAYLFTRGTTGWAQHLYVKARNPGSGDQFGRSVALRADGNVLAVGAPREDSACRCVNDAPIDEAAADSGAAYVFSRPNGALSQRDYVKAPNTETDDDFGHSVALSADGNVLVVTAQAEDSAATGINGNPHDNSASLSGAAFVYSW